MHALAYVHVKCNETQLQLSFYVLKKLIRAFCNALSPTLLRASQHSLLLSRQLAAAARQAKLRLIRLLVHQPA